MLSQPVSATEYGLSEVEPAVPFSIVSPVVEEPGLVDETAEERSHIVDVAENWNITVDTYSDCARWVWYVLEAAGWENAPYWSGAMYWERFADISHDITNIPVGAIVIGTGTNSDTSGSGYHHGHVGICLGDRDGDGELDIRHCIGPGSTNVVTDSLSSWIRWQTDSYCGYQYHQPGFVGWIYYPDLERAGVDFDM